MGRGGRGRILSFRTVFESIALAGILAYLVTLNRSCLRWISNYAHCCLLSIIVCLLGPIASSIAGVVKRGGKTADKPGKTVGSNGWLDSQGVSGEGKTEDVVDGTEDMSGTLDMCGTGNMGGAEDPVGRTDNTDGAEDACRTGNTGEVEDVVDRAGNMDGMEDPVEDQGHRQDAGCVQDRQHG